MKFNGKLVALGLGLALGSTQSALAATLQEEDSVYDWGRWSVLSPAAGGEPYHGAIEPQASHNVRPGDAAEFLPKVSSVSGPSEVEPEPPLTEPPTDNAPGVVPVDPDKPIVNLPPPPPPPGGGGVGVVPVDPDKPVVNLPSPPPPPPPAS